MRLLCLPILYHIIFYLYISLVARLSANQKKKSEMKCFWWIFFSVFLCVFLFCYSSSYGCSIYCFFHNSDNSKTTTNMFNHLVLYTFRWIWTQNWHTQVGSFMDFAIIKFNSFWRLFLLLLFCFYFYLFQTNAICAVAIRKNCVCESVVYVYKLCNYINGTEIWFLVSWSIQHTHTH